MSDTPMISICVPAYKRVEFVRVLLNSISIQTYRDIEVIVTDDSADDELSKLCGEFGDTMPIRYIRNDRPMGTPANWNCAMRHAKGDWIKLMHDDDWFEGPGSLAAFAEAIQLNPAAEFLFSAFQNVSRGGVKTLISAERFRMRQLIRDPVTLLSKNIIGPPSVVIHKNNRRHYYDEDLQWLVDMDFYIRYLSDSKPHYIDKPLVNIGLNELQVTRSSSLVREVEIPEHFHVLEKTGIHHLNNLMVYDAWWRLFRNLRIDNVNEIAAAGYTQPIPPALGNMINMQRNIPGSVLRYGPASKSMMVASYIFNRSKGLLK